MRPRQVNGLPLRRQGGRRCGAERGDQVNLLRPGIADLVFDARRDDQRAVCAKRRLIVAKPTCAGAAGHHNHLLAVVLVHWRFGSCRERLHPNLGAREPVGGPSQGLMFNARQMMFLDVRVLFDGHGDFSITTGAATTPFG
jgi:hypothetical protein